MLKFSYPAVCVQQSNESKPLILFGAPAIEIERWAGIPQKKSFSSDISESAGFQRTENKKRLEQLEFFFSNHNNVVQNSLICGLKKIVDGSVRFISSDGISGYVEIIFPDVYKMPFVKLFELLKGSVIERLGDVDEYVDYRLIDILKSKLAYSNVDSNFEEDDLNDTSSIEAEDNNSVVFEESHLEDFLKDIVARYEILKELIDQDDIQYGKEFLGFERNAILSFLLPVTLVDGQHRLKGAIRHAYASLKTGESVDKAAELISEGAESEEVEAKLLLSNSRRLPVSLLMDDDPKEQVFQFVVINQKATPIGKSLLGTIISTSLTTSEMDSVSSRLEESGISLDDARAITWAARNPSSPFYELVERGVDNGKKDLLQWNVMGSLIEIFRELKGGSLFHTKNDYAKSWKEKYLEQSGICSASSLEESYEEWRKLDGIWRDVFITFWTKVKQEFSQSENADRHNYWGNTRKSNIFNKISLTILAADFFKYLSVAKKKVDSLEHLEELMDEWLEDVSREYFDRNWELSGVKKDSTGIRERWSENWADYRENPVQLPQIRSYRNPKK